MALLKRLLTTISAAALALAALGPANAASGPICPAQDAAQSQSQGQGSAESRTGTSVVIVPPSLGELAREQRAERTKNPSPPSRVFTNDTLPKASGGVSVIGGSSSEKQAAVTTESEADSPGRLRIRAANLKERLDTHQRELGVLQQKLGESQVQFYPNPNDILHQEYSREDINRLSQAIDEKKQQVEADEQALKDVEDELARRGLAPTLPDVAPPAPKPDLSGVEKGSEQYWRLRFKAAREAVARAQEQQKLAEDELALLQSQQAHELATGDAAAFDSPITAKQSEVESKRAAVEQAQQELDKLGEEFKTSGSPQAWSEPQIDH